MRSFECSLTRRGQITIPAEIRARLGLRPGDRVRFDAEDNVLVMRPVTSRILLHIGTITPHQQPEDWRAVRKQVEELVAADVVAESV